MVWYQKNWCICICTLKNNSYVTLVSALLQLFELLSWRRLQLWQRNSLQFGAELLEFSSNLSTKWVKIGSGAELLGKITQHRWNNLVNAWIIGSNCISTLKNNSSWSKKCSWCFTSSWISRDKLCSLDQRSKGASKKPLKAQGALLHLFVYYYTRLC